MIKRKNKHKMQLDYLFKTLMISKQNEHSYSILFNRYQRDVGYIEAKETLKIRLIVRLPLVVKFKMTYLKMKLRDIN